MVALEVFVLSAALLGANDAVLLQFTSDQCPHCRSMASTIERLQRDGFPIRSYDVDERADLVRRHHVSSTPTLVLLSNGREAGRLVGPSSYDRLVRMFGQAGFRPPVAGLVRGQSPERKGFLSSALQSFSKLGESEPEPEGPPTGLTPRQRASQATVRLRVEDATGFSHGTGTIIDVHGDEALVLTCGHIFRESNGKGKIQITLFPTNGQRKEVLGQLIDYEPDVRDIGLVSIRPGIPIEAAPIAADTQSFARGDRVFTIGCNQGRDPTLLESSVNSINRFKGSPNIEAAGTPIVGRSGGGLFTHDGRLIGVCKLANATDNEGIYASLPNIHLHLDRIGQSRIYQQTAKAGTTLAAPSSARATPRSPSSTNNAPPLVPMSDATLRSPQEADLAVTAATGGGSSPLLSIRDASLSRHSVPSSNSELIFIIRQPGDPNGKVVVLREPSAELLALIKSEGQRRPASRSPIAPTSRPQSVVRAQSNEQR